MPMSGNRAKYSINKCLKASNYCATHSPRETQWLNLKIRSPQMFSLPWNISCLCCVAIQFALADKWTRLQLYLARNLFTSAEPDRGVTSNAAADIVSLAPYVNAAAPALPGSQSRSLLSVNLTVMRSLSHTVKGRRWPRESPACASHESLLSLCLTASSYLVIYLLCCLLSCILIPSLCSQHFGGKMYR